MLGWCSRAALRISREEAVEDAAAVERWPLTTLRTSIRPMSVFWAR